LNLKRKAVLKRSLKKKRKKRKSYPPYLSAQTAQQPTNPLPRAGPCSLSFSFAIADTWAPLVSLSLSPFLSSSPCLAGLPPQPRIPPRPVSSPSFLSSPDLPIKALNRPRSIGAVSPFLAPSRDGRGHQWQAPPLGARSPPLAILPLALLKPVLERLRLPLPSQHTHSLARAPIHLCRRLGFPPPPSNRRRRRRPFSLSLWVHQGLIKLN
jgi:hypothetical protein